MIVAEITVTPVVENDLQPYLDAVIEVVKASGLAYELVPMGTAVEGEQLEDIFKVAMEAHNAVKSMGVGRILTELRLDDRLGYPSDLNDKEDYSSAI